MAASGINEHKEGCRKQRVLDRAANARKIIMSDLATKDNMVPQQTAAMDNPEAPGYMRKMGSPPGILGTTGPCDMECKAADLDIAGNHSPTAIDKLRREGVRAQQLVAYSAKLPDRLSSVNYTQQW